MKKRRHLRPYFLVCLFLLSLFTGWLFLKLPAHASDREHDRPLVIYFYSSVCRACNAAEESLNEVKSAGAEARSRMEPDILVYNIEDRQNYELFQKYLDYYKVKKQDRYVPIVFLGNAYYSGLSNIQKGLRAEFAKESITGAVLLRLSGADQERVEGQFSRMGALGVFLAGLIGGFNPCSLSMLLFFLSLVLARRASVLKMGLSFGAGKFAAYLLLGTVLYRFLSQLHGTWFALLTKSFLLIFVLVVAGLSIKDFFAARREKYNSIVNQLPVGLRKWNHQWIKKFASGGDIKLLVLMSALLGVIISAGEFLCTGQIYIATIAYIIQGGSSLTLRAFIYLLVYDIAFVLPLIFLTVLIDRGKSVFDMTEFLRRRLPAIKLVTGIAFLILGVLILFIL
jgi:cytochrome c biogenesis protein CcdA